MGFPFYTGIFRSKIDSEINSRLESLQRVVSNEIISNEITKIVRRFDMLIMEHYDLITKFKSKQRILSDCATLFQVSLKFYLFLK